MGAVSDGGSVESGLAALERSATPADTVKLLEAVRALSASVSLEAVIGEVKRFARELTGADGVTFVLRDGEACWYVDEDAIAPLWKGRRFPAETCISGWCMAHRAPVAIADVFADARIPGDVYRPTFVRSMAMVPVRSSDPMAAIGAYWASPHQATERELGLLQGLADATAVALANAELLATARRAEERFRHLADGMPHRVWTTDAAGRADYFNACWYRDTGRTPEESLGLAWQSALVPECAFSMDTHWTGAMRGGGPWECACRLIGPDGEVRWMLVRAAPLESEAEQVTRWVVSATDIHEQKLAEQALAHAVQARDQFLSVAGHELRTPLTALRLQLDGARRELARSSAASGDVALRDRLERAAASVQRISDLVSELLDVTRMSAGPLRLEPRTTDLATLVRAAVAHQWDAAAANGCELRVFTEPVIVEADPERLDQVVTNLVSNAIKYGHGCPVEVVLRRERAHALLSVRDGGIGIPEADQRRIFGRFERAAPATSYGGLGLGLWIAQRVVEAHGGTIGVVSAPGEGALFTVRLPLPPG